MTASLNHSPKAFVIGWPISHSKSPLIHNYWIAQLGLEGFYEKVAVEPEKLADFIAGLRQQRYRGGNVTIPHKEAVLDHVDVIHPTAKKLGAANTLWFEGEKLHADNTDGYGFLANLDQSQPGWDQPTADAKSKKALVLGAGGASRPIINGLIERGFNSVTLVNRTRERAESVAGIFKDLGYENLVTAQDWQHRNDLVSDMDLLVNTTALGMSGQPKLELSLDKLPQTALVTDIVYTPLKTNLLKEAAVNGNRVVDGLGMLLHQAVPGFEKWFGKRPEVTQSLRDIVLA